MIIKHSKCSMMIIGNDFNSKAKLVLQLILEFSEAEIDRRVSVADISDVFSSDKTEIKNIIEYLDSRDCIKIETFGGPYLYGDVTITKKGIVKAQK